MKPVKKGQKYPKRNPKSNRSCKKQIQSTGELKSSRNHNRVNGVAPGPVWTPLIPASFPPEEVAKFGTDSPMKRPAQPVEIAPAYVLLESEDASFISGQILHINGGELVNG